MQFKNITNTSKGKDIANLVSGTGQEKNINVFLHKDTLIIFGQSGNIKHASLSNNSRMISENEINYTVKNIMKTNIDNVRSGITSNGVLHIFYETEMSTGILH